MKGPPIAHESGTNPVPMMGVRRKCNLGKIENVIPCQEPISPKDTVNEAVDLYVSRHPRTHVLKGFAFSAP